MKNKETLEEAAEKCFKEKEALGYTYEIADGFKLGAKWQQEQDKNKFSEEDLDMLRKFMIQEQNFSKSCLDVFIEQFKKKIR
jgi:hypothetical protein